MMLAENEAGLRGRGSMAIGSQGRKVGARTMLVGSLALVLAVSAICNVGIVRARLQREVRHAEAADEGLSQEASRAVMKTLRKAQSDVERWIVAVDLLAATAGGFWMMMVAGKVTRPLERMTRTVRAFAEGDGKAPLPESGTREVRELSTAIAQMRTEVHGRTRALREAERVTTIGLMASSVSHDLRHYLAAVYANAEFLASPSLCDVERAECFEEIRLAVNGTTEMLDSLLMFRDTGEPVKRTPSALDVVVDRAVTLVRMHPDARRVEIRLEKTEADTTAWLDQKRIERAVHSLVLNACQSARESKGLREVTVWIGADEQTVSVTVADSGSGVAEGIREHLFDPFVSQGKLKGAGLGLTLAWRVARQHDGDVRLVSSRPGETIFRLTVSRWTTSGVGAAKQDAPYSSTLL